MFDASLFRFWASSRNPDDGQAIVRARVVLVPAGVSARLDLHHFADRAHMLGW